jgi:hypothetical protein
MMILYNTITLNNRIWDQIAKLLHAGTEHSNLIMALYDCEADMEHMQMCTTAGVKHYPTMQFMSLASSASDSDSSSSSSSSKKKKKGVVRLQRKKPHHTTIYAGNWQYGDAVYDWLRAMLALSQWHRRGWGKKLRDFFTGAKKPQPKDKALPIGIPKTSAAAAFMESLASSSSSASSSPFSSSSSSSTASSSSLADAAKIQELQTEVKQLNDMVLRSSTFVEAILFPLSTGNYTVNDSASGSSSSSSRRNYTDVFALLTANNGWTSTNDTTDRILRTCALDISVDYCGRLANQLTLEMLEEQLSQALDDPLSSLTDDDITRLSEQIVAQVAAQEPFCPKAEECVAHGLTNSINETTIAAYYSSCPFNDRNACRYVSACLSPDIQAEYALALKKVEDIQAKHAQQQQAATTSTTASTPSATTKKGWFA